MPEPAPVTIAILPLLLIDLHLTRSVRPTIVDLTLRVRNNLLLTEILLSTLNARYAHAAFGLRYLLANLGELKQRAAIAEFDISQRPIDIAESILARRPSILGLEIYIWNVGPMT